MARRRFDGEPNWPPHFRIFRSGDGWESEWEWRLERTKWARAMGYKQYKVLPLIQALTKGRPAGGDDDGG